MAAYMDFHRMPSNENNANLNWMPQNTKECSGRNSGIA